MDFSGTYGGARSLKDVWTVTVQKDGSALEKLRPTAVAEISANLDRTEKSSIEMLCEIAATLLGVDFGCMEQWNSFKIKSS